MINILWGPDTYSRQQEVDRIKKELGDPELLSLNTTVLIGKDTTPEQIKEFCSTTPFLSPARLIIVEGLLQSFESDTKKGRDKGSSGKKDKKEIGKWKNLAELLKDIPENVCLLFIDDTVSDKNPLYKSLSSMASVKTFPMMKDRQLREWINNRIKSENGQITPGAIKLLLELVGNDLWKLNSELAKLQSYCNGRSITENDVKQITSYSKDINIFYLVDCVLEKRTSEAERLVKRIVNEGVSPSYIISMILRQLRLIVKAKHIDRKKNTSEIASILGYPSEYLIGKTMKQADIYTMDQIKSVFQKILDMDVSIKTGKYENDLAVDILVFDLCR
jgi:DNA polymerase-3 subunit delta